MPTRRTGNGRVDPAEEVVAPERDDERVDLRGQRPVDAGKAALRRVARDAGVEDGGRRAFRVEPALELRDEAVLGRQAVALGEAVAEGGDRHFGRRRRRGDDNCREKVAGGAARAISERTRA
jgi:hypothetical protein